MTDNEIKKALEHCKQPSRKHDCEECPYGCNGGMCTTNMLNDTIDLINRKTAESEDLYYKLRGVMHFVDKWLDGDELKQDEVQRADTMREKMLQVIEEKETEIERLNAENVKLTVNMNAFGLGMKRLSEELEKTKSVCKKKIKGLRKTAQRFQDDIVCVVGTDFMQDVAEAENKFIFEILNELESAVSAPELPKAR